MLIEYPLDISAEIAYAKKWAYSRNPAYYNFDKNGGDCTNFISQCLYAGGAVMNYTPDIGWYYNSPDDRAAAWTSVEYLNKFLINNKDIGPFGKTVPLSEAKKGDLIQLGNEERFYHSLLVVDVRNGIPYIAAHMNNAFEIPLTLYEYEQVRCIHILGARKYAS
ncbi:MAG: amidase domain-containing protein [Oscillospiraceae bacterium]|nr:amidase domain-containing protein [Oscillospiraceae bacterium]